MSNSEYAPNILMFFLLEGELLRVSVSESLEIFPVAVAEPSIWGHQCSGVKRKPPEDPVKNGACSRNVRPRRGLWGRVRRLGSGGGWSSHGTLSLNRWFSGSLNSDTNTIKSSVHLASDIGWILILGRFRDKLCHSFLGRWRHRRCLCGRQWRHTPQA